MNRPSVIKRTFLALTLAIVVAPMAPAAAGPEDDLLRLLMRAENVTATGVGPETIFVTWIDRSPVETLYRVEVATDEAGPYVPVTAKACTSTIPFTPIPVPQVDQLCATSFQAGPIADPTPRFVRVVPVIEVGGVTVLEGLASEPDPAILGPLPPTDLKCNGGGDLACYLVNSITLTWTDNSDEAEFWIMRARAPFNPDFGTTPHARVPANTTTWSEVLSEYSTTFWYRIAAVRRYNIARLDGSVTVEEGYSGSLRTDTGAEKIKVETAPVPPPSDPDGLTAVFIPPSTAKLTWSDPGAPLASYLDEHKWHIEWGPAFDDQELQTTKSPFDGQGTVTFRDDRVPPDTTRCYRVRGARNGPAFSAYTNVACIGSIPKAPANLIATALDNSTVNLAWTDRSDAETHFDVQRCNGVCSNSSTWTSIGQADANATSFSDDNVVSTTTYSYRIFAVNDSGRSPPSNIAVVATPVAPLSAPTSLAATPLDSHKIRLTWVDNATNETGFQIEFKRSGDWEELTTVGPKTGTGVVSFVDDMDLAAQERRCYRVRAVKVAKRSDPSNEACARTLEAAVPNGRPTNLTADPHSNLAIDLRWKDNATNEYSFRIEMIEIRDLACPQSTAGLTFAKVATAPGLDGTGIVSHRVGGLVPHSAYFFRVFAVNKDGESLPSNTAGCVQTFGPRKPVFLDPSENGDVETTRCHVDVEALVSQTDRLRLTVTAFVPNTQAVDHHTVWAEEPYSGNTWRVPYKFLRGINYTLTARAYGPAPNEYFSADVLVRDIKVLADCPLGADPV